MHDSFAYMWNAWKSLQLELNKIKYKRQDQNSILFDYSLCHVVFDVRVFFAWNTNLICWIATVAQENHNKYLLFRLHFICLDFIELEQHLEMTSFSNWNNKCFVQSHNLMFTPSTALSIESNVLSDFDDFLHKFDFSKNPHLQFNKLVEAFVTVRSNLKNRYFY